MREHTHQINARNKCKLHLIKSKQPLVKISKGSSSTDTVLTELPSQIKELQSLIVFSKSVNKHLKYSGSS